MVNDFKIFFIIKQKKALCDVFRGRSIFEFINSKFQSFRGFEHATSSKYARSWNMVRM